MKQNNFLLKIVGHFGSVLQIFSILYFFTPETKSQMITFQKTFGGNESEEGRSVQQTSDGGYIIVGGTESFGAGGVDVYLVKTDANGNILFSKTIGGSTDDFGLSVRQTSDGGYIIAGVTGNFDTDSFDVYLVKTDANGDTLFTKTFGGSDVDLGYSVQQTSDGGYIIAGTTGNFETGPINVYLVKTDANGNTLFTKTFGDFFAFGYSVQQTSDGGYIIVGFINSLGGGQEDLYLVKTDANGDTLFTKTFGGSGSNEEVGNSVKQTSDGGYIIVGETEDSDTHDHDVYLVKTDANGDTLFTKTFGGSSGDYGYSVQQTSDGGYIIAGGTYSFGAGESDVYLVKTDANGDTLFTKMFGGSSGDFGYSVQQTSDGGYIIVGDTESFGAVNRNVYLIKTNANGVVSVKENEYTPQHFLLQQNYPNPFNPKTKIKYEIAKSGFVSLKIYDVLGLEIKTLVNKNQNVGTYEIDFNASNLNSGIYFYKLTTENFSEMKKMILVK